MICPIPPGTPMAGGRFHKQASPATNCTGCQHFRDFGYQCAADWPVGPSGNRRCDWLKPLNQEQRELWAAFIASLRPESTKPPTSRATP